ncbi:MAG TPA: hypothetical protein VE291_11495 [Terracidiphilus sp.]|jgi:hypothetical protein|nr:hypothetical protein [Terracidiphilus sp.]
MALRQNGIETSGKVNSLQRFGRSGHMVLYTFTANGVTVYGKATVSSASMESLHESSILTVRFLSSNPSINQPLVSEQSLLQIWDMILIPMPFLGILGVLFVILNRRRHLLSMGAPAVGLVTECNFNGRSFLVKYEFVTDAQVTIKGAGWSQDLQKSGQRLWILYLSKNPRRNRPYPFSDYKLEE